MRKIHLLFVVILGVVVFAEQPKTQKLPNEASLAVLQQRTVEAWSRFEAKAFPAFIDYYYNSDFSNDAVKQSFYELTVEYENLLKNIHSEQLDYKRRIEEYEGDDWDMRFGKNALWRKFESLTNQNTYLIAKCLYYRLLCVPQDQADSIMQSIFEQINSISGGVDELYRQMLEARVYMLLRESNESYYDEIFKRLDAVELEMTADTELYYDMWICRLNLLKPFSKTQLDRIIDNFNRSVQADNMLIAMRLAFLQIQVGDSSLLESNFEKWPQLADFLALKLYTKAQNELKLAQATDYITSLTHYERQLLAAVSLNKVDEKLDTLISSFGVGDDQSDRVLSYVAAVKNAQKNPRIAVLSALNSLSKPAYQNNVFRDITDIKVLAVAAKAGFVLLKDEDYTDRMVDIFNRYKKLAGSEADSMLVFGYAAAMQDVRPSLAEQVLTEIHEQGGEYSDKALFELLVTRFNKDKDISEQIASLYERCDQTDIVFCTDVTDLYCRQLASSDHLPQAMALLCDGYSKGWTFDSGCGLYVLEKFLEQAELFISDKGNAILDKATLIAGKIVDDQQKFPAIRIVYIETSVLAGIDIATIGDMPEFTDVFETLQYSRSQARYFQLAGDYYEAAFIWGKIARAVASSSPIQLWRWQRAKYYQLACSGKSDEVSDTDLLHSIEVLEAESNWSAGYWSHKLTKIKPNIPEPTPITPPSTQQQSE